MAIKKLKSKIQELEIKDKVIEEIDDFSQNQKNF